MRDRRSPVRYVLLVLLAVATGVLVWFADQHVRNAAQTVAQAVPAASTPASTPGSSTVAPLPTAVFLGDGYTAGTDGKSWADIVAAQKGWREVNLAAPGMGFKAVADECAQKPCTALGGQIEKVVEQKPQVVVVMAGAADGQAIQPAQVATFVKTLRSVLPVDTQVYLVSPVVTDAKAPAWVGTIDGALKTAAQANKATYVDIGQPLAGKSDLATRPGEPTPPGHQAIADAVVHALG